jgi:hypothetical protein
VKGSAMAHQYDRAQTEIIKQLHELSKTHQAEITHRSFYSGDGWHEVIDVQYCKSKFSENKDSLKKLFNKIMGKKYESQLDNR